MEKSKIQYDRKAKIKLQVERITDRIIEAFTIESRRVFYTEDEDLISYEESEARLIRYGAILAIALATTASILISHNVAVESGKIIQNYPLAKTQFYQKYPVPMLALMDKYGNGTLKKFFLTQNLTFQEYSTMHLPQPHIAKEEGGNTYFSYDKYFAFVNRNTVNIVSGDLRKDIIVVHPNGTHRTIPNSKFRPEKLVGAETVQVGRFFWTFGGLVMFNTKNDNFDLLHMVNEYWYKSKKTTLWSLNRQKWISGPDLPDYITGGCGIPMNRSHVLL